MQARTKQGLQTLRRVQSFLASRAFTVAIGDLKAHSSELDALVTKLEQHATEQDARARNAREATRHKQELGAQLRQEYLRPIARMARALFPDDPTLRDAFQLPARRDDEGLLQAANAVAERAKVHEARFVARGFAPDFVERLLAAAGQFRQALVARGLELGRRSAASAGMLQELGRGRQLVQLIDAMLAPRLATQADQLAEWRTITRFVRRGVGEVVPVTTGGGTVGSGAPGAGAPGSGAPIGGAALGRPESAAAGAQEVKAA